MLLESYISDLVHQQFSAHWVAQSFKLLDQLMERMERMLEAMDAIVIQKFCLREEMMQLWITSQSTNNLLLGDRERQNM